MSCHVASCEYVIQFSIRGLARVVSHICVMINYASDTLTLQAAAVLSRLRLEKGLIENDGTSEIGSSSRPGTLHVFFLGLEMHVYCLSLYKACCHLKFFGPSFPSPIIVEQHVLSHMPSFLSLGSLTPDF
jgi:hypothetical protein